MSFETREIITPDNQTSSTVGQKRQDKLGVSLDTFVRVVGVKVDQIVGRCLVAGEHLAGGWSHAALDFRRIRRPQIGLTVIGSLIDRYDSGIFLDVLSKTQRGVPAKAPHFQ